MVESASFETFTDAPLHSRLVFDLVEIGIESGNMDIIDTVCHIDIIAIKEKAVVVVAFLKFFQLPVAFGIVGGEKKSAFVES